MSSLKNKLIVAMPHMLDPYFTKAVVLICDHTEEGAMGLIINRPFEEPGLRGLISEIYEENEKILKAVPTIYFGGPVMIERGIVLHSSEYMTNETIRVSDNYSLTSQKEILKQINSKNGPTHYKLMLGHAGWGKGQLEREIKNGDWLLLDAESEYIFHTDDQKVWNQATHQFNIGLAQVSGHGGQA